MNVVQINNPEGVNIMITVAALLLELQLFPHI